MRRISASRLCDAREGLPRAFAARAELQLEDGPDLAAEAFERGRAAGHAAALAELESRSAALAHELGLALKRLCELQEQLTREHKTLMLELALEAASRIVRQRIEAGDPVAARALEEAVGALPTSLPLKARLHPDDLETVKAQLEQTIERRRIELAGDAAVERGGCIVESLAGTIDATLEQAIVAVRASASGAPERR